MRRAHGATPAATADIRRPRSIGSLAYGLLISILLLLAVAIFTVLGLVLFPISALLGILCYLVALVGVIGLVKEIMHML
jgi:hypothetical protein